MTLLHVFSDDKFVDGAVKIFEETPHVNNYVCLRDEDVTMPYKYIQCVDKVRPIQRKGMIELLQDDRIDIYIYHSLDASRYDYVLQIPIAKKIIWIAWGYDLYRSMGYFSEVYPMDLYHPLTKSYMGLQSYSFGSRLRRKIKQCLKWIIYPRRQYAHYRHQQYVAHERMFAAEKQERVLQRIDYLSTVLPIEYAKIRTYRNLRADYFPFQYTSKRLCEGVGEIDFKRANHILVGNSADPTNNHLDIVRILRERGIKNPLYMPLAYGDDLYRNSLMNILHEDKTIIYQTMFCDADAYRKNLLQCKVAVFGHMRQQAIGNVLIAMRQGSKVFLYKNSMAYKYLKQQDCVVYSIEDELTPEEIATPMSPQDIQRNYNQIYYQFGFDNVVQRLNDALEKIEL